MDWVQNSMTDVGKVEKISVEIRVKVPGYDDAIYGICHGLGIHVKRWYKGEGYFVFSIPVGGVVEDGRIVSVDVADRNKLLNLLRLKYLDNVISVTTIFAVYFEEDESEFFISKESIAFLADIGSALWVYTYPKGDWTDG